MCAVAYVDGGGTTQIVIRERIAGVPVVVLGSGQLPVGVISVGFIGGTGAHFFQIVIAIINIFDRIASGFGNVCGVVILVAVVVGIP